MKWVLYFHSLSKMNKPHKKKYQKFNYPHPILKTFQPLPQEDLTYSPYSYQPSITNNPNTLPAKALKCTHTWPKVQKPFSLLLHPLHPTILAPEISHTKKCSGCGCYVTPRTGQHVSIFQNKCVLCGNVNQCEPYEREYPPIFEMSSPGRQPQKQKNILFLIEANQHLYNLQVHDVICQCLEGLKDNQNPKTNACQSNNSIQSTCNEEEPPVSQYKIAIVLFNKERVFVLDLSDNQVIIVDPIQFKGEEIPLIGNFFQQLGQIDFAECQKMVKEIMYQSFMQDFSCLPALLEMLQTFSSKNISMKAFIHSTRFQKPVPTCEKIQYYLFNEKDCRRLQKTDDALFQRIYRVYRPQNQELEIQLYYDLFHNLTQDLYHQATLNVHCPKFLKPSFHKNINTLSSNSPLIIKFDWVKGQYDERKHITVQIVLQFDQCERVFQYQAQIADKKIGEPFCLNDQTYFYALLVEYFTQPTPTIQLNKYLSSFGEQILKNIQEQTHEQFSHVIPRNLTNFFMYIFMIGRLFPSSCASPTAYEKHLFLREGLQTISKQIYPKVYKIFPNPKSFKFCYKNFSHQELAVIDDGRSISIVIGREVDKDLLQNIFGVFDGRLSDLDPIYELPILQHEENTKMRSFIGDLRSRNQLYYLRIRIMELDDQLFRMDYGQYLYDDNEHRRFFRKMLQNIGAY